MGFFNRGMYFSFLYKKIENLIGADMDAANSLINNVVNETYGVPILVYHEISDRENQYCVSERTFCWQIDYLLQNNYNFLTYKKLINGEFNYCQKNVLISFDDARKGVYITGKRIVQDKKIPIMMFVAPKYQNEKAALNIGDNISEFMTWDEIGEWFDSGGMEIGAHSYSHIDMTGLLDEQIEEEIEKCNESLKSNLGIKCRDFAFPYGKYRKENISVLKKYYDTISTLGSGLNYKNISLLQLRRTAVLRMFSKEDFIKLVDYSEIRNKFLKLRKEQ